MSQESAKESGMREFPRHIAIIMDGNGRWAANRGMPRIVGHQHGVEAVRRTVRAAVILKIPYLTLYSFSSENWSRPEEEVSGLMTLLRNYIRRDLVELHEEGVCIRVIGKTTGVADDIKKLIQDAQTLTKDNKVLNLTVAFNYGSRNEIVRAAQKLSASVKNNQIDPQQINEELFSSYLDTSGLPDPDLLIRTSGEYRLSNFLLWQCAYSEFVFLNIYWPDFNQETLEAAIEEYLHRERRFGGIKKRSSA